MSTMMDNLYEVLGVEKSSTDQDIRHAYQKLALQCHPDKQNTINETKSCETFTRISEAWRILGDDKLRKEYDDKLRDAVSVSHLPINEDVMLSEMIYDQDLNGYTKACRCGGAYILPNEDVPDEDCVVYCDTCSLCIKVTFSLISNTVIK